MFGIGTITTNDLTYKYQKADGTNAVQRFFPENKIVFIGVPSLGSCIWGVTPEEEETGPFTAMSSQQYITITQWDTPDPVAVWTKASGVFIPVLPDPGGLFIATDATPGGASGASVVSDTGTAEKSAKKVKQEAEKMAYADFDFYTNEYGGTAVGEEDFKFLANKASLYIDAVTRRRARTASGDVLEAVKMAMCALADVFLDEENVNAASFSEDALLSSLSSETVGRWSKSYKTRASSTADLQVLEKRKNDAIMLHLGWTGLLRAVGYYARGC